MDIRRIIDARDGLFARLEKVRAERDRLRTALGGRRRGLARINRLDAEEEKLERGITRLNDWAADVAEGVSRPSRPSFSGGTTMRQLQEGSITRVTVAGRPAGYRREGECYHVFVFDGPGKNARVLRESWTVGSVRDALAEIRELALELDGAGPRPYTE